MSADTLFFFLTLGLLIVNFIVLFVLFVVYKKNKHAEDVVYKSGNKILLEAQEKAKSILETTVIKSKEILSETEYIKEGMTKDVEQSLQLAAKNEIALLDSKATQIDAWYKQIFEEIKNKQMQKATQSAEFMDKVATQQMEEFRRELSKETVQIEDVVAKKAESYFQEIKKQIDDYKAQKVAEIAQSANKMVLKVAEEVLYRGISHEDQEKLIIEALEKAKQENAFENISTGK